MKVTCLNSACFYGIFNIYSTVMNKIQSYMYVSVLLAALLGVSVFWADKREINSEVREKGVFFEQLEGHSGDATVEDTLLANEKLAAIRRENGNQRISLTNEEYGKYLDKINPDHWSVARCEVDFKSRLEPSETIIFDDLIRGIKLKLPFNNDWGGETFLIPPFETEKNIRDADQITFGPISSMFEGGCGWLRPYTLTFNEPIDLHDIDYHALKSNDDYNLITDLQVEKVSGKTIAYYSISDYCTNYYVIIFGFKHNYELMVSCGEEKDLQILLEVARSAELY